MNQQYQKSLLPKTDHILEYWSVGVLEFPFFHYSTTPSLQVSAWRKTGCVKFLQAISEHLENTGGLKRL